MIQDHLRELERQLEIKLDTPPGEQGVFFLNVDEDVTVKFELLDEGTYMSCILCEIPKNNREDLFIMLAEMNLMGEGSLGNVFGLTKESKHLTMSRLIDYDMGYPQFFEVVEDFVNLGKITLDEIRARA